MPEHGKKKLLEEIKALDHESAHELPKKIKNAAALDDVSDRQESDGQKSWRRRGSGYAHRQARAGDPEARNYPRSGAGREQRRFRRTLMSWTGAFGRACGKLLYAIVRGLSLTHISPNILTFTGLVINIIAAVLFGYAKGDHQPR